MTGAELERFMRENDRRIVVRDAATCAQALHDAYAAASEAAAISVPMTDYLRAATAAVPDDTALDEYVTTLPEALYVVAGCLAGRSEAIALFEREYFGAVVPALKGMNLDESTIDDVRQLVRQKLFVPATGGSSLATYIGRGSLRNFVRVVAVRTALDTLRKTKPEVKDPDAVLMNVSSAAESPQMQVLKSRFQNEFKAAFEMAMSLLSAEERNLLRMSFVAKLTIDDIGHFYRVHRTTAARRLAHARERLAELTRAQLHTTLDLDEGEFTSILRLIQTQLDLSISRILKD